VIDAVIKVGFWLLNLIVLPGIVLFCLCERVWQWVR
jgi:hypothetical protein